jgi:hypothetical protein
LGRGRGGWLQGLGGYSRVYPVATANGRTRCGSTVRAKIQPARGLHPLTPDCLCRWGPEQQTGRVVNPFFCRPSLCPYLIWFPCRFIQPRQPPVQSSANRWFPDTLYPPAAVIPCCVSARSDIHSAQQHPSPSHTKQRHRKVHVVLSRPFRKPSLSEASRSVLSCNNDSWIH